MIPVPVPKDANDTSLITFTNELIQQCMVSVGSRTDVYRLLNLITQTGKYDGSKSLINLMGSHIDRTAAHLFSPVELKFSIDFINTYPKKFLDMANVVGRQITRSWELTSTDKEFGNGVKEALKYGWCGLKQWPQIEGPPEDEKTIYYKKLVMPWNFGVYNETEKDISLQSALCETTRMTLPEVWRRVHHLPNAKYVYDAIKEHARKGAAVSEPESYVHQIISTSQLDTGINGSTSVRPGGLVQLGANASYMTQSPQIAADTVEWHELWVQDENDYTTIQMVAPNVIVAPRHKKSNLLGLPRQQPYRTICPNESVNWFWGQSELVDLVEPQGLLSQWADDIRRLFGLQIDKILFFVGEDGITDERYGQMRNAGFGTVGPNSKIEDVTPQMPPETMTMLKFVIDIINMIGSFPEIMQGKGESGVRAGSHANTLLKTASPTLRDRALLVERQCAIAADLTLQMREAKDPATYWTKADDLKQIEETSFKLTDLPEDWRVTVDSHSSSPIFSDENANLVMAAHAKGIVTKEYVLETLPFPNKEAAKAQNAEDEKKKAASMQQLMQQNPELGEKIVQRQMLGGRR